jgi:superfamily II DNA/RNA helicase
MASAAEAYTPPPLQSLAQVVVREGLSHLTTGLRNLRETPPHILIGTPQALLDIWREDPKALQLSHLSSVVVDEVDYLIETLPKKDPNRSFRKAVIKASKKLQAHPGVTRELLDVIYAQRKELNEMRQDEPGATLHRRRTGLVEQRGDSPSPQLIMSSATLRSHLNNYLYEESGWLNKDNLLKVKGTTAGTQQLGDQNKNNALRASGILHSVLLVSDTGIENVSGAVPHTSDTEEHQRIDAETLFAHPTNSEAIELDKHLVESKFSLCVVSSLQLIL